MFTVLSAIRKHEGGFSQGIIQVRTATVYPPKTSVLNFSVFPTFTVAYMCERLVFALSSFLKFDPDTHVLYAKHP